jgi:integrase
MPKKRKSTDQDGLYRRTDSPYWWASYTDASGSRTRRSTGTCDRKEADALLAKWRLETHRERQWGEQPSRTFDELMLAYLKGPGALKRSRERDSYSAKRLYPAFTGRDLHTLTAVDIRAYIGGRRSDGAEPGTINRELGLLSAAINYARTEWDWDIPNPAQGRRFSEPEGRVRWITRDVADALIQFASAEPQAPHLADFIRLALNTGCRRDELLRLEWRRVDTRAALIHLGAEDTKSGKRRSVPLNAPAREAIAARAAFRAEHCPASPWVFCDSDGKRVQSIKRSWATACRRAEIEDFRIHDLRHTCAAWLVSAGVPLTEVRDLLGHSTIRMTERYAHLAPENVRAAVARLEGKTAEKKPPNGGGESRSGHVTLKVIRGGSA